MKIAGLDIGTTSVSGVIIDTETGGQIVSRTIPNDTLVQTEPWMREQDAGKILRICLELLGEFRELCPELKRIGLTGQMHGIVYLDREGRLLGNLINWQDERGNRPFRDGLSYAQYLQRETGCPMSTGFGLASHFYNTVNHLVPEGAAKLCTIMDYLAMVLSGETSPCIHPSNAAGLGLYSVPEQRFEEEKMRALGMDPSILPRLVTEERLIGRTAEGLEVMIPIGDNQAGTFGMLKEEGDILINIGTSSQISVACSSYTLRPGLECRPYVGGRYLLLYAGLCGGVSFALLNRFLREVCGMFSVEASETEVFEKMMEEAGKAYGTGDDLSVSTLFRGKRTAPEKRGSVTNIDMDNFTPGKLILGFYEGVIEELFDAFREELPKHGGRLLLAGNAFRSNALLRRICEDRFGRKALLLTRKEEAAYGSALLSAEAGAGRLTVETLN